LWELVEFRLISRVRDGFRDNRAFYITCAEKKKEYSHPLETMVRLQYMLPRVTSPCALTRSVFRPLGPSNPAAINYFCKITRLCSLFKSKFAFVRATDKKISLRIFSSKLCGTSLNTNHNCIISYEITIIFKFRKRKYDVKFINHETKTIKNL